MEITTTTGREDHTTYGAVGAVFVLDAGAETPIFAAPGARLLEQEWARVDPRGVHGRWCTARYDVPEGTILKVWAASTYHGSTRDGGGGYFVVEAGAMPLQVTGGAYAGRGGQVTGRLRPLTLAEIEAQGVHVNPRLRHFYQSGKLTCAPPTGPAPVPTVSAPAGAAGWPWAPDTAEDAHGP